MDTRLGLDFEQTFDTIDTGNLPSIFTLEGNQTPQVVDDIDGHRALWVSLNHFTDTVPDRTELVPRHLPAADFDNGMNAKLGHTYYYGISMYMPADWQNDSSMEILQQWHGTPDPGEAWRSPMVALQLHPMAEWH